MNLKGENSKGAEKDRINSLPQTRRPTFWLLGALAIGFTVALTFATIELTRLAENLFPHSDIFPYYGTEAERFLRIARPVGYACFAVVLVLIVVGLVTGRRARAFLGAGLLFLPTFGHFAGYMFFLAGLGILRVIWLPIWEEYIHLGDIAYIPYMIIVWPLWQVGIDARWAVAYIAIGLGLFVLIIATLAWFLARYRGLSLANLWIYRYSRHPQYLGWILWSYGIMLLAAEGPVVMGGRNPGASLPWVISTLVIVCVALSEEARMLKELGTKYERYRTITPFLVPLPRWLRRLASAPLRFVVRGGYPGSGREIISVFSIYLILVMALSALFSWPLLLVWAERPY